jgi:hypothetical protein
MHQMPLLEVARIILKMRLPIQPLPLPRNFPHPPHLRAIRTKSLEILPLLPQLPRHTLHIHIQILPQKPPHLCILMIPHKRLRLLGIRTININVCGGVPVRAPPRLRAARDHIRVRVQGSQGRVGDGLDLLLCVVADAQAGGDAVDDEDFLLLVRGRGKEVTRVVGGEALGGVRGVG